MSSTRALTIDELVYRLENTVRLDGRIVVGISGYAGAGKSTISRAVVSRLESALRVRVDDFLDPGKVHRRSADWNGVERERLHEQVIAPFKNGDVVWISPLDWSSGTLGEPEALPPASILCVEGIGLFHPFLAQVFDIRVWIDCHPATAMSRGKERDRRAGLEHDAIWSDIWFANDADFDDRFAPERHAHVVVAND